MSESAIIHGTSSPVKYLRQGATSWQNIVAKKLKMHHFLEIVQHTYLPLFKI